VISFTAAPPAGTSFWGIQLGDVGLAQTPNQNAMTTQVYTATAGQTTFTVNGGYTPGQLEVFRNGVMLVGGVDYTATNGTTFVLTNAATVGDTLVSVAYVSFIVANAVAKSGDTMTGNLNITGGTLQVGGNQAVNGPAFSAWLGADSGSITANTFTKIAINTEEFDTNSNYDSSTNYRFTPTVAGYYQISGASQMGGSTNTTLAFVSIYKNGTRFKDGAIVRDTSGTGNMAATVSTVIYFNGSTDYVELYGYVNGTGTLKFIGAANHFSYFSGGMIRGA
jgi:hypothetical protein